MKQGVERKHEQRLPYLFIANSWTARKYSLGLVSHSAVPKLHT